MKGYVSMRRKMVVYLVAMAILALLPFGFLKFFAKNMIMEIFSYKARLNSSKIVSELSFTIEGAKDQADRMAFFFSSFLAGRTAILADDRMSVVSSSKTSAKLANILPGMISENIRLARERLSGAYFRICGSTVAFVPGELPGIGRYSPFYYTLQGERQFRYKDLALEKERYEDYDWFRIPLESGKPYWSKPYTDRIGSGRMLVTYSTPVIVQGRTVAIVTMDISINDINMLLDKRNVADNAGGYSLLLMYGRYGVASDNMDSAPYRNGVVDFLEMRKSGMVVGDEAMVKYVDFLLSFVRDAEESLKSHPGIDYGDFIEIFVENCGTMNTPLFDPFLKKNTRYYCTPVEFSRDFILVVATPEDALFDSISGIQKRAGVMVLAILIFLSPFVVILSGIAVAPLKKLKVQADRYAVGDFDYRSDVVEPSPLRRGLFGASSEVVAVSEALNDLGGKLKASFSEIKGAKREIIRHLAIASEYRDTDTGKHVARVSGYSRVLALRAGMTVQEAEQVAEASVMHDVGKIGISDNILLKKGRLTDEEYRIMKTHTSIGMDILSGGSSALLAAAERIAGSHHEKWNGEGYPAGLKGEEIPLEGRIVAICDVFDALTTERPYKKPWTSDEAFAFIERERGASFDPRLVDLFLAARDEILRVKEEIGA